MRCPFRASQPLGILVDAVLERVLPQAFAEWQYSIRLAQRGFGCPMESGPQRHRRLALLPVRSPTQWPVAHFTLGASRSGQPVGSPRGGASGVSRFSVGVYIPLATLDPARRAVFSRCSSHRSLPPGDSPPRPCAAPFSTFRGVFEGLRGCTVHHPLSEETFSVETSSEFLQVEVTCP